MIKEGITNKVKGSPPGNAKGDSMKKVREDLAGKFQLILGVVLLIGSIIAMIYTGKYIKEGNLFSSLQDTGIPSLQIGDSILTFFYILSALIIIALIMLILDGFSKILNSKLKKE